MIQSKKKIITFFTSSRADYDLIKNLKKLFLNNKKYEVHLIITGTHLSKNFGLTVDQIDYQKTNSFFIKVNTNVSSPKDIMNVSSVYLKKFQKYFSKYNPNIVVLLGDRYEALMFAYCAYLNLSKIVHLHGGELTTGAYDDAFRHSISKFAHLHFVSHKTYKKRLIQLGEFNKYIFNYGAFAVDNIFNRKNYSIKDLSKILDFDLIQKKYFLVSYHPETIKGKTTIKDFKILMESLIKFNKYKVIISLTNADTYSHQFMKITNEYVNKYENFFLLKSYGSEIFLSLIEKAEIFIGNSSSGIIESPYLKTFFLLIGDRQNGRILSKNIIKINPSSNIIIRSIKKILTLKVIKSRIQTFGKNDVAIRTYDQINKSIDKIKFKKIFNDIIIP